MSRLAVAVVRPASHRAAGALAVPVRYFARPGAKAASQDSAGDEVDTAFDGNQKKKIKNWFEAMLTSEKYTDTRTPEEKKAEKDFVLEIQRKVNEREARQHYLENRKIQVKIKAVEALPELLRVEALKEDPNPWPLNLLIPSNTPPHKEFIESHFLLKKASSASTAAAAAAAASKRR